MTGLVLIDKTAGCTSHDIVNRWRRLANTRRVGHLGTLDPMATGLLALLTGSATRLAQFFSRDEKIYLAGITLGRTSDSYDADGTVFETGVVPPRDRAVILSALDSFRGRFLQKPPPISAKKIGGVPAYKLVRKQVPVELPPVEVEVTRLEVTSIAVPLLEVLVACSPGTYLRSIAHDLGQKLGCGAILSSLRRIRSGEFTVDQAHTVASLDRLAGEGRLAEAVIPSGKLLQQIPAEYFDSSAEAQIRQGRDFRTSPFVVPSGAARVRALSQSGSLIAIGELKMPNVYHPRTVL
ncbi:MAG TPA: tRNA pseudouridine(55) synthase TruB [Bryobacteraceae bacterium]|jgi:tRNA pseudouridine55 synthase